MTWARHGLCIMRGSNHCQIIPWPRSCAICLCMSSVDSQNAFPPTYFQIPSYMFPRISWFCNPLPFENRSIFKCRNIMLLYSLFAGNIILCFNYSLFVVGIRKRSAFYPSTLVSGDEKIHGLRPPSDLDKSPAVVLLRICLADVASSRLPLHR